jgi:hypothetical protein
MVCSRRVFLAVSRWGHEELKVVEQATLVLDNDGGGGIP